MHQKLQNIAKTVIRKKFIALNSFTRQDKRSERSAILEHKRKKMKLKANKNNTN